MFLGYTYQEMCRQLYVANSALGYWAIMFCVITGIFIVSILFDKIRIKLWDIISMRIEWK